MEINQQIGRITDRTGADYWPTPSSAVEDFLRVAPDFRDPIREPAAGDGAISKVLEEAGYKVISSDLYDYGFGTPGVDFLTADLDPVPTIITNPPYNQAEEFLTRALDLADVVAFLLPLYFMTARRRLSLMRFLSAVYVYTYRVPFILPGYEKPLNHKLYAWFIFSKFDRIRPAEVHFITRGE